MRDIVRRSIGGCLTRSVVFLPAEVELLGEPWLRNTASRMGMLVRKHPGGAVTVYKPEDLLDGGRRRPLRSPIPPRERGPDDV